MESRTRFAIGGMSTVVVSVAVVCAVALTNSVALADSAGVPVKASPVVVPSPSPSTSRDVARPLASDTTRVAAATVIPDAEMVPAPAPIAVKATAASDASRPTSAAALADAQASGSWEPVRLWANANGWPQGRIDAWIQRLESGRLAEVDRVSDPPAGPAENQSGDEGDRLTASESQKTSANADEHSERGSAKPDVGSKKDQSRDSPDRRD